MRNYKGIDTDTLNYYPLQDGRVPASSAKMKRLSTLPAERQSLFQIDKWVKQTLVHKLQLNTSNRKDMYFSKRKSGPLSFDGELAALYSFIVKHLTEAYPSFFNSCYDPSRNTLNLHCLLTGEVLTFTNDRKGLYYQHFQEIAESNGLPFGYPNEYKIHYTRTGFEALAMQVPEDIVFYARKNDSDIGEVAWAHLMSPAGWSTEWAIGKSFTEIHAKVKKSDGTPVIKHPPGMINGIMRMKEGVERVGAISFRTYFKQDLHPDVEPECSWNFDENQELYIRFERQTVTPFPPLNGFLFTVRPYYANLLNPKRISKAIEALENIDDSSYYRNLLEERGTDIIAFLKHKKDEYGRLGFTVE